jgi:hypothetical protein
MAGENAVVSVVVRLVPALERPAAELLRAEDGLWVELEDGRRARLDPDDERSPGFAQILDGLRQQRLPVYLELNPDSSAIERLLIPLVTRVRAIRPFRENALAVELDRSHAVHLVRADAPNRAELEQRLLEAERKNATVVVSETDSHEIVDVRDYTGPERPSAPFAEPRPMRPQPAQPAREWRECLYAIWRWLYCWLFECVSVSRAQQVFDAMSATSCAPLTVPAPCIPFLYPDDGCWARASEMCRLMFNMGLKPRKLWIQGSLHASTRNNPNCFVDWGWHVAPTLCVRSACFFLSQRMVIDPSLFTTPVSQASWKAVQGDPNATLTDTDASDYFWGATDPNYTQTNSDLAYYRLQLQNRVLQQGPPPYANCP